VTIEATSLSFSYRPGTPVLRAVTASFPAASVTCIVGPNGAGKSTLLRALAGLASPTSGTATLDGTPVTALRAADRARRVVHIPQASRVGFAFSALEVVRMGRYAVGGDRSDHAARRALDQVGLLDRADDVFSSLSAGQQQRVTIARALAQLDLPRHTTNTPASRALLADEPVSAMDPRYAQLSLGLLRDAARTGSAVVVVLHDLAAALRHADRAILLDQRGTIAASGSAEEVLRPERLEPVFGVPFRAFESDGRRVSIVPA